MNKIIKNIPNALTCCNLLCGCLGIIEVFKGNLQDAAYFVYAGAFFDFIDGMVARMLNAKSSIGKDLDSLSDLVTFGVLPGFSTYILIKIGTPNPYLPYIALLIPLFSAIRLAIFNNDTRQASDFYGLPTPANALFFISIPLILFTDNTGLKEYFQHPYVLAFLSVLFSFIMVAPIKLFSFKIKKLSLDYDNLFPVILLVGSNILFFSLFFTAFPFIIILYIILSLLKNLLQK